MSIIATYEKLDAQSTSIIIVYIVIIQYPTLTAGCCNIG